jgi:hypothetical protein
LPSHRGGECDSDQQSFRSDETADSLAPGFLFILYEHSIPLRLQLPSRLFDVIQVKLEPRLTGRFTGDTLTFSGDSGGDNFTIHIDSTGVLQADGTMTGVFKAHFVDFNDAHEVVRQTDQEIPWTATRGQRGTK